MVRVVRLPLPPEGEPLTKEQEQAMTDQVMGVVGAALAGVPVGEPVQTEIDPDDDRSFDDIMREAFKKHDCGDWNELRAEMEAEGNVSGFAEHGDRGAFRNEGDAQ